MLDASFLTKLEELTQRPQLVTPEPGQLVLARDGKLSHVPPKPTPLPAALTFSTLAGLVAYLATNRDELTTDALVLQVVSATEVRLLGPLTGEDRARPVYAKAVAVDALEGFLGSWLGQAEFNVALLSRFEDLPVDGARGPDDKASLLTLCQRLVDEQRVEHHDDGRGQSVTARKGVHLNEQVDVPNPQHLTGWRTFREVDQPTVPYVFRMRNGHGEPQLALFEQDGGTWRLEAAKRVARWLETAQQGALGELPEADRPAPVAVLA